MEILKAEFIKSAASPADFIRDGLPCAVFAGRSNVGKSSLINMLVNRKNLARVGSAPGKTSHINYFKINEGCYFTDLPGYGYAKVSKSEKHRWGRLMQAFFSEPLLVSCGVLIVDSRHKPTQDDITMAGWFLETGRPCIVVANKCDKLKKSEYTTSLECVRQTLELPENVPTFHISAGRGYGREELRTRIMRTLFGQASAGDGK